MTQLTQTLGFEVTEEAGALIGRRTAPLTDYQIAHGCVGLVTADSAEELSLLCQAALISSQLIALAEMAGVQDRELRAGRRRFRR